MAHQITFDLVYEYDSGRPGILIPISLGFGAQSLVTEAHLDTGAANCFFRRSLGEKLGLDVASGHLRGFSSPGGMVEGYGHFITLEAFGEEFDTLVYFAKEHHFTRNLLGRQGWMQRWRMGLVDYEGMLYLSRYDNSQS
ncbi:MAG TPA: hypothetical protein PLD20_08605 [Blastocatellia bacterium]|nr:hypothetical protein [Blastocatellia bacterium]HMV81634.1 hypothetical protein [Blastocatellia bacterium]HMX29589.1 hypothetical protein [Blastocatellia bacterium]HMY76953.1 hypothetical protein [Blastocatellia bacterium]HMZ17976.1 hypothetical protein [Blastocatellia bacterium]